MSMSADVVFVAADDVFVFKTEGKIKAITILGMV